MNKILIIGRSQFGYHSDTYYLCKYLRDEWDITYISWDYGQERMNMNGVKAKYISRKGYYIRRKIRFIKAISDEIKKSNFDIHFIKEFKGCSLLKILHPSNTFIFDIRSGAVYQNRFARIFYDCVLRLESSVFKHKTVISNSLARKLKIDAYLMPLGADIISDTQKTFTEMRLLYIGTLYNRNIYQTIKGFSKFYHQYKDKIRMRYTIVGSGPGKEEQELKQLVVRENLSDAVTITGHIPHDRIKPYFDSHNIGVSYIPMTEYFDVQPPTKTFEYLLSGMPVIATATQENKAVICSNNGILINDTSEHFLKSLSEFLHNRIRYDSDQIRKNAMPYTWYKIIFEFKKYLANIGDKKTSKGSNRWPVRSGSTN